MAKPKFIYQDWYPKHGLDPNSTPKEVKTWLEKEKEFWIGGRFGLTGPHYFFLTQCTYTDGGTGEILRPLWRDVDDELFGTYDESVNNDHDMLVLKRRELGFTLIFGACLPLWHCFTKSNITVLGTSSDKTKLENMYVDKIFPMYQNFDPLLKPALAYRDKNNSMLHFGKMDQKTGEVGGLNTKYSAMETVKNPKAFEAFRSPYIVADEIFINPKIDQVFRSGQASTRRGFRKIGTFVMGGSAGETTADGMKASSVIWQNAEDLKVNTIFIPGTKGILEAPEYGPDGKEIPGKYLNFCPNGYSNETAALEWIMRTREQLDKIDDKKFLNTFVKQYPLTVQEVLQVDGAGSLPKDLLEKVNVRERIIVSSKPAIVRCSLTRDQEGKIKIVANDQGRVRILQNPIEDRKYIAGIDPIPFNTDQIHKGSQQVMVLKDRDLQRYVAWMSDRGSDPEPIVKEQIMLQELFNGAKAMLEINRGSSTRDVYKNEQKLALLATRPTLLGKGFMQGEGSIGFYKANSGFIDEHLNKFWLAYLHKYMDEIYFQEFLADAKNWPDENCDIVDAMQACELYDQQLVKVYQRANPHTTKRVRETRMIVWENGRAVVKWVPIQS